MANADDSPALQTVSDSSLSGNTDAALRTRLRPHAFLRGTGGGVLSGLGAAKIFTMPNPKTPIQRMLEKVAWAPLEIVDEINDSMPYATHSGVLDIAGVQIRCFRLNTGEAMIDSRDMEKLFPGWRETMIGAGHEVPNSIQFRTP